MQQDGATSHISNDDSTWQEYLEELGLEDKIELYEQPPNSPDLNQNDLGFFASLQARYNTECPRGYTDIIRCVEKHYWDYPHNTLNRLWLTRMQVMNEIIDHNGDNNFKLTHMGKAKLEREGTLPLVLEVTDSAQLHL